MSTIEEGMLSVLAFKKSLFAGVLDGGAREVFLGGSRLKRFMESVDAVTAAASGTAAPAAEPPRTSGGFPMAVSEGTAAAGRDRGPVTLRPSTASSSGKDDAGQRVPAGASAGVHEGSQPSGDSWTSLLTAGLKLVESLTAASSGNGNGANSARARFIETDAQTGRAYLKLPVPDPQVLQQLGEALSQLVRNLAK